MNSSRTGMKKPVRGAFAVLILTLPAFLHAGTYLYQPINSAAENWSSGANWSAVPVSASDTVLLMAGDNLNALPNGVTNITLNDVANPFELNELTLQGKGPAAGAGTVTIGGYPLRFTANGSVLPSVNLLAMAGTAALTYTGTASIVLATNLTFAGDGTAGFVFTGPLSGSAPLIKRGASTLQFNGDSRATFTGPVYLRGGQLKMNTGFGGRLPTTQEIVFDGPGASYNVDNNNTLMNVTNASVQFRAGSASVISTRTTANNAFLTFGSWSRAPGATAGFSVPNGSVGSNVKITLPGQAAGFMGGAFAYGGGFAWYDSGSPQTVRGLNYLTDPGSTTLMGSQPSLGAATGKHVQYTATVATAVSAAGATVSSATLTVSATNGITAGSILTGNGIPADTFVKDMAGATLTLSKLATVTNLTLLTPYSAVTNQSDETIASLHFKAAGGTVLLGAGQTLTVSGGGIWRADNVGNSAAVIAGGNGLTTGSGQELVFWSDSVNGWLSLQTPILSTTTGGIVKAGPGQVRMAAANTFTGGVWLNGGLIDLQSSEEAGVSGPLGAGGPIYFYGGQIRHSASNAFDYSSRFSTAPNQVFDVNPYGQSVVLASDLISENGALNYNATLGGTLTLSGNSTYNGGSTLTAGNLVLGSDTALGSGPVTIAGAIAFRSIGAETRVLANPLVFNSSPTFGINDGVNYGNIVWIGPAVFRADTTLLALGQNNGPVSAVAFEGPIVEYGGRRNLVVTGRTDGSGQGYIFLLGANTYSGQTIINNVGAAGPIVINTIGNDGETASSLGAPTGTTRIIRLATGNSSSSAGIIRYIGGPTSTDRPLSVGGATGGNYSSPQLDASGYGPIRFTADMILNGSASTARNLNLNGVNRDTNTFAGVITNFTSGSSMGIAKNGCGVWVLSATNTLLGGLTVNGGRLVLDYPATGPVVPAANTLTLGDTVELKANADAATTQTLGNLSTLLNSRGRIVLTRPGAASLGLTLGNTWTRGAGSTLFVDAGSGATLAANPAAQLVSGLIGWAVFRDATGTGFATTDGASVARFTAGTPLAAGFATDTTNNFLVAGDLTLTGASRNIGSTVSFSAADGTLNLSGLTMSLSGIRALLFTGSGGYTITNGTLSAAANEMIIHQYAAGVVLLAATNGTSSGSITKDGPGVLVMKSRGSSGQLRILDGVVRADGLTNVLTAGSILLNNGGILELGAAGNFTGNLGTAAGNIQFAGDGGFSAYGADRMVQLNSGTGVINWGGANFIPANHALVLGSASSDALVDFQNNLNFINQQRVVDVGNGSAALDARLSGVLTSRYGGGLIKRGEGALEVTGANSYLGDTWVEEGELRVSGTTGSGLVTVFDGAAISGTGTVNRLTLRPGGRLVQLAAVGGVPGALKVTGQLDISQGTLDLSGLGPLGPGDQVIVECGSLNGSSFAVVEGLPANRSIVYSPSGIVLKSRKMGLVITVR